MDPGTSCRHSSRRALSPARTGPKDRRLRLYSQKEATRGHETLHPLGGPVHGQPMTYAVNGQQYVSMTIGNTLYTFGLDGDE